jgi:hypothetical protein
MRIPIRNVLLALALLAGAALAGCSSDHSTMPVAAQPIDDSQLDLNQPYGGLTPAGEPAPQNDPDYAAALAEDEGEAVSDPVAASPEVQALERAALSAAGVAAPRFTFVRVVWGVLDRPDSTGDDLVDRTDWSGSVHIDRGFLVVRRTIRFEWPHDHLVFPRPDRFTASWVSHTGRGRDGLVLEIIEPPLRAGQTDTLPPNQVTFTTAPFAHTFTLAELAGADSTFAAGPEGNAIRFSAFGVTPVPGCPEGFLAGAWTARSDSAGVFKGRWLGVRGELSGFLHGAWGYDNSGTRVLVGRWITRTGAFGGLLQGRWAPGPVPGRGTFAGHWVGADRVREGAFRGHYGRIAGTPLGQFSGLWATDCDAQAAAQVR